MAFSVLYFCIISDTKSSTAFCIQLSSASINNSTSFSLANLQTLWYRSTTLFHCSCSSTEKGFSSLFLVYKFGFPKPVGLKTAIGMASLLSEKLIISSVFWVAASKKDSTSFPSTEKSNTELTPFSYIASITGKQSFSLIPPQKWSNTVALITLSTGRFALIAKLLNAFPTLTKGSNEIILNKR